MTDDLIKFLKKYGYPVRLRGYLLDADIETEDIFILYEETDSQSCMEYSNRTNCILWTWTVHLISKSPAKVNDFVRKLKKDSLFTPFSFEGLGSGYPVTGTDYYGRQLKIQTLERI